MKISLKGIDKFRTKVPALAGKRIAILPAIVFMMLTLSISWMSFMYRLPGIFPLPQNATWLGSLAPLFGFLLVKILGFFLASQMWFWRDFLKVRYGPRSYQRILPFGLVGIICAGSLGFDLYLPYFLNLPFSLGAVSLSRDGCAAGLIVGLASLIGPLVKGILGVGHLNCRFGHGTTIIFNPRV